MEPSLSGYSGRRELVLNARASSTNRKMAATRAVKAKCRPKGAYFQNAVLRTQLNNAVLLRLCWDFTATKNESPRQKTGCSVPPYPIWGGSWTSDWVFG